MYRESPAILLSNNIAWFSLKEVFFCFLLAYINYQPEPKAERTKRSLSRRSVEVCVDVCLSLPKYKFVAHLEICGFECYHCLIAWIFQSMESAILVYALGFPNLAILATSQSIPLPGLSIFICSRSQILATWSLDFYL